MEKYNIIIGEFGVGGLGNPVHTTVLIYIGYTNKNREIIKQSGRVLIPCSDDEYKKYRNFVKEYSVIQVLGKKVERANSDSPDFEVEQVLSWSVETTILEKEFLTKEQVPVKFVDEKFGEFVLDKRLHSFEGEMDVNGNTIIITLEHKEDIFTLYKTAEDVDGFINKAGEYVA